MCCATHSKSYLTAWISMWNQGPIRLGHSKKSPCNLAWPFPPRKTECCEDQVVFCTHFTQVLVKAWCPKWWSIKTILWSVLAAFPPQMQWDWSESRQDFISLWTFTCLISSQQYYLPFFIRLSLTGLFSNYMSSGWSPIKMSVTRKRLTALILSILTGW